MSELSGSVIIVTHNSSECISDCPRALSTSEWEIVVIDNASEDDTVARVKASSGNVRLIENNRNAGFGAAVNQGVRQTHTELLLILNPDSIARVDALNNIAQAVQSADAAAAGGLLADADGRPQIGFVVRRFPRVVDMLAEILLLNRLWPGNSWNRHYRCLDLDYTKQQEVDQPAGACLAFRREIWRKVGGFDESFFPVWFEDVDFCRRIRDAGGKIIYTPDAVFTHAGGHSVGKLSYAGAADALVPQSPALFYKAQRVDLSICFEGGDSNWTIDEGYAHNLGNETRRSEHQRCNSSICWDDLDVLHTGTVRYVNCDNSAQVSHPSCPRKVFE